MSWREIIQYSNVPVSVDGDHIIVNGKVYEVEEAAEAIISESHQQDENFCFPKEVYEDDSRRLPDYSYSQ